MLLAVLAQAARAKANEPSVAFELGETIAYGAIAIFVFLMIASAWVTRDAVKYDRDMGAKIGFAMFLSLLVPLIATALAARGFIEGGLWVPVLMGAGILCWFGTLVGYTIVSQRWKTQDDAMEKDRQAALYADVKPGGTNPQFSPGDEVSDDTEPAVLPDSAGHLSAMGKIGSLRDAPPGVPANAPTLHPDKGPRASEIDGNPPLPPGEVKIRSLCCNQKMRNSGERLGKQRRCPKCGVAPFRYKLEPENQSPPA
ncbi:MAG: hypothetical protein KF754_12650 [Planctomycetes bacterium]|nr:hypothetical protein [Planctomycetota bacterium]